MPCGKLVQFLQAQRVDYQLVEHALAFAARDVAARAGVPRQAFAKTVVVHLDGEPAMAVLPADDKISFDRLRDAAGAGTITLAIESEFTDQFPDCEPGAMPPFGNLYGMRVYVDDHLIGAHTIAFNAGTHDEVIVMAYEDFARLVKPTPAHFTFRPLQESRAWG